MADGYRTQTGSHALYTLGKHLRSTRHAMETMDCTAAGAAVMEQCSTIGADKYDESAQSVSAAENAVRRVAWWRTGRALDLRSRGRGFDSRVGAQLRNDRGQVAHTRLPRRRQSSMESLNRVPLPYEAGPVLGVG